MKTIAIIFLLSVSQIFAQQTKTQIEITFSNQKSSDGKIFLAIYDNEKSFGTPEKAFFTNVYSATNPFWALIEIKRGSYAIAVYQDINNNGKLDKNWFGIPTEPYGFSNDPIIRFGPPAFNDCLLELTSNKKVTISLR
jgi:uncharacterized protein (DUF2141 family)